MTENFIYSRWANGQDILYDLKKDPEENKNVAGEKAYRNVVEKMQGQLKARKEKADSF